MSYNDEISEMTRNFAQLYAERDSALQELALANSELKRLQAENKELKEKIIGIDKNGKYYYVEENNNYKQALEEIRGICKCSKEMNCEECPQCNDCEELCVNDENLQDIFIDKINEVLNGN